MGSPWGVVPVEKRRIGAPWRQRAHAKRPQSGSGAPMERQRSAKRTPKRVPRGAKKTGKGEKSKLWSRSLPLRRPRSRTVNMNV